MRVEVLERDNNRLSLILWDVPVIIANSIRRAMISEVPTLAIEHVFIYKNSSVMDDEILAHRLGLIPLKTDLQKYVPNDECECKSEMGCPKCSVTMYLEAKAGEEVKVVYSGDIKSEDEGVVPVSEDIPIVKLAPGQEISIEMRAIMGRGKEHAKWQPVSVAVVRGIPVFMVDEMTCDLCGKCIDACPKKLLEVRNGKIMIKDLYACTTCEACAKSCPKGAIKVDIDESSSILSLESNGQLRPEEIVLKAIEILMKKTETFAEEFKSLKLE
ncbi:DNA-directed RNA polymerase subunit D [Candidatus Geothermarchaeota archaeon]|nr:MAG: DNA-directed RNA polymerase subunit D [Candidatus Geothermarchaeota archaeon]